LSRNPRVLSIEEDLSITVDPTSVTQTNAPWGLDRIDQRTLPLSGSFTSPGNGAGVSVYVVDTGIDASHAEFGGRVASGFDAVSGGDGRTDCNGHGTHVAGTAGAATYGVAKSVRLVPVRVLGCDGSGTYSGVIAGLDWIAKTVAVGEKAVANMSLGGGASSSLDAAVASLVSAGVTVVVAAGNSNVDACTTSPARTASAITVGASTTADARASYSNFGRCLDVFAPGSNILSTIPGGGTATYSGTSMAAPHVAGVAAVVLSLRDLSPSALAAYLVEVATTGVVVGAGTESPNLLAYLPPTSVTPTPVQPDPVATAPAQPSAPIAEARNKAAVVTWGIPDDGGSTISSQTVRAYSGGRVVASIVVDGVTSSTRITRLRNGTDYTFTVQARNAVGVGAESPQSNSVRPLR
jgi:subtilisin family serine protease